MLAVGKWLFSVHSFLGFSMSSLYLAVSLLDRLHRLHFQVEEPKGKLLGGCLLLISTKFNEV
jgi:hypothetical protein